MHSSRMYTVRCSGCLSCHAHHPATHTAPLPRMPPTTHASPVMHAPPATHTPYHACPPCHACPLPCTPPCHTCPPYTRPPCHMPSTTDAPQPYHACPHPTTHAPCHACPPLIHAPPCHECPLPVDRMTRHLWKHNLSATTVADGKMLAKHYLRYQQYLSFP